MNPSSSYMACVSRGEEDGERMNRFKDDCEEVVEENKDEVVEKDIRQH